MASNLKQVERFYKEHERGDYKFDVYMNESDNLQVTLYKDHEGARCIGECLNEYVDVPFSKRDSAYDIIDRTNLALSERISRAIESVSSHNGASERSRKTVKGLYGMLDIIDACLEDAESLNNIKDSVQDTNYRIRMDNKVVEVYETNALFYKVYVHTDINDKGELYVSVGSGDIEVEAWADTNQYDDDEVFTLITDDLESQLDGVMARYERSSEDTPDEILDAIEELYDYLEGVNEMWTNYDAWSEVDED